MMNYDTDDGDDDTDDGDNDNDYDEVNTDSDAGDDDCDDDDDDGNVDDGNIDLMMMTINSGLPTSEILFPYFVEKISVFWETFPYPLICSSLDSKHSLGNFLFTLVGPIHSQWKL